MKRFFIAGLMMLCGFAVAQAEPVDAVYYNPSHLGRYDVLKVTHTLDALGGVIVQENMTISSGGTTEISGANRGYEFTGIETTKAVDLKNTNVTAGSISGRSDTAEWSFTGAGKSSSVGSVTAGAHLKSGVFEAETTGGTPGWVNFTGTSAKQYDGTTRGGLSLGGNVIPVQDVNNTLKWVDRKDDSGKMWKLLGMQGTAAATCTGSATQPCGCNNAGIQTRTCNNGVWSFFGGCSASECTCSDDSYLVGHKSECCPSSDYSVHSCWNFEWVLVDTETFNGYNECNSSLATQMIVCTPHDSCDPADVVYLERALGLYADVCDDQVAGDGGRFSVMYQCNSSGMSYWRTRYSFECQASHNGW